MYSAAWAGNVIDETMAEIRRRRKKQEQINDAGVIRHYLVCELSDDFRAPEIARRSDRYSGAYYGSVGYPREIADGSMFALFDLGGGIQYGMNMRHADDEFRAAVAAGAVLLPAYGGFDLVTDSKTAEEIKLRRIRNALDPRGMDGDGI